MTHVHGSLEGAVRGRLGLSRLLFACSAAGLGTAGLVRVGPVAVCLLVIGLIGTVLGAALSLYSPMALRPRCRSVVIVLLMLDAAVCGLALGTARQASLNPPRLPAAALQRAVTVAGVVDGPMRATGRGAEGRLMVTTIRPAGASDPLVGRPVLLRMKADPGDSPLLEQGAVVTVTGRLEAPRPASRNGYDEAAALRRGGMGLILTVRPSALRIDGRRHGPAGLIDAIRRHAEHSLAVGVTGSESALLRGVILGETADLDPSLLDAFRRSGTAHILSVSGLHVASLAAAVLVLARVAGLRRSRASALALGVIAVFALVTGAGPSVVRASVMAACALGAWMAGRGRDTWQAFFAAACVVLAVDPGALSTPGFQLSFVAVAGILALSRTFERWLEQVLPRGVASTLAVSLAAGMATAPISLVHFGQTSAVAVLANLFVVPTASPVMGLGLAGIAVDLVWPFGSALCNLAASVILAWVTEVARLFARAPVITAADLGAVAWIATGAAVSLPGLFVALGRAPPRWTRWSPLSWMRPTRGRRRPGLVAAVLVLALGGAGGLVAGRVVSAAGTVALAAWGRSGWPPRGEVRVLDVGQGSALLIRTAAGHAALIDGGPARAGLAPALRDLGVRRLDMVVVSHPHADHFAGLSEKGVPPIGLVIDAVQVVPGDRVSAGPSRPQDAEGVAYLAWRRGIVDQGGRVLETSAPRRVRLDEVTIDLVPGRTRLIMRAGPRPWGPAVPSGDRLNDASLVAIVRTRTLAILDPGDAEAPVLERLPLGPVDVLVVPHHGSEGAVSTKLLEVLRPRLACISVGEANSFGHPDQSTLAQLKEAHVPVLRTDRSGSLVLSQRPSASAGGNIPSGESAPLQTVCAGRVAPSGQAGGLW